MSAGVVVAAEPALSQGRTGQPQSCSICECRQGASFKRIDTGLTNMECQMLDLTPISRFLLPPM
jgi:hypothetical protein